MPTPLRGHSSVFVLSCALLAPFSAAWTAPGDEHIPRVLPRDLPLLDRVLRLDESQRAILEALLSDVEASGGGQDAMLAFRENLAAVLNEPQLHSLGEAWTAIYRERMEMGGAIGGEAVDVGALARAAMRGETTEALERAIAAYRAELDPLLNERMKLAGENSPEMRAVRLAIRDANERAIGAISAALPEAVGEPFRRDALRKCYPSALAPSVAISELVKLTDELPTDAVRGVLAEAERRYGELCARGIATVKARDEGRGDAPGVVVEVEREYDEFEYWLVGRVVEVAGREALAATPTGKTILDHLATLQNGAAHRWDDRRATVQRFDKNGNGVIDGDESNAVLESFSKSVGRQARRKL